MIHLIKKHFSNFLINPLLACLEVASNRNCSSLTNSWKGYIDLIISEVILQTGDEVARFCIVKFDNYSRFTARFTKSKKVKKIN